MAYLLFYFGRSHLAKNELLPSRIAEKKMTEISPEELRIGGVIQSYTRQVPSLQAIKRYLGLLALLLREITSTFSAWQNKMDRN
jgi:hypothetical protein